MQVQTISDTLFNLQTYTKPKQDKQVKNMKYNKIDADRFEKQERIERQMDRIERAFYIDELDYGIFD